MQGVRAGFLVQELRSHIPCTANKKTNACVCIYIYARVCVGVGVCVPILYTLAGSQAAQCHAEA